MTQALWVLCLLLLAAGYIADPSGPVLAAGLAALALPVLSWLAVLLCRRKLRAELSCPASAEKGRPAAVRLTLRRPRALPVGRVRFHLAAENTVTGETACMTLPEGESAVSGRLCGCLTLRITGVTVWDAFSLLPVPAPCRARGQLCVMPDTFPLDMEDFQALRPRREGSVYDPGRRGTDRTETFQVRDYAPGDSLRQVHWKLSGKTGRLVVRDPARPVDHRLTVLVLRQKAPPSLADALMEAAASLCQALEGRSFRLAWNGPEGYESRTLGAQGAAGPGPAGADEVPGSGVRPASLAGGGHGDLPVLPGAAGPAGKRPGAAVQPTGRRARRLYPGADAPTNPAVDQECAIT